MMDMPSQQHQPLFSAGSTGTPLGAASPDSEPAAARALVVRRLAQLFSQEPELILASLECLEPDPTTDADVIMDAAIQAAAGRPTYADLHYFAARAAVRADHLDRAETLLEQALNLNPRYNDALILMARVCLVRENQEAALIHLRSALLNGADYADVHVMLGDLWHRRDEVARAQQAYTRALDLNANLHAAREGLAALPPSSPSGEIHELPA